ncbi:MAG: TolC family protein [Lentimicrobiaceae bacterium]|jgi:outer membrane protein TolC|nr:TolC family protein [Lentimicrobiaceae bacterium]MCP4909139.1 TolC family protein [Bacteroidota bacterium]MBT3453979.1 TolC family protein [Lentimicrobiaceae bacterium]MBT3819097.1 TolC family protein [Lentimicrobiaceae bacterium]MBT4060525.1 TolC family protein [Lentimicrobiaceae bacterium]
MIKHIVFVFALIIVFELPAQNIKYFSVDGAIAYAMDNNYQVINAQKDVKAAIFKVKESTAIGLPQIDGSIQYNDNIARPVMILPPEFTQPGQSSEIQFGTKYDATLGASLNQLIFSGEYVVGLQAARKYLEKSNTDFFKSKVDVKQQVSNSYYDVLSASRALKIVDSTLVVNRNQLNETRELYNVGFSEDIDVDQFELIVSDLEASALYLKNQLIISTAYLKFFLGLNNSDSIILTDNLEELIDLRHKKGLIIDPFNVNDNIDYISMEKQKQLSRLQLKLEKSTYMPSLSASLYYQTQAQRDDWNFFNSGKWYSSSALGVTMNVPVFSSGMRRSKVKQAQIAYEKLGVSQQQLESQLNLQFDAAKNEYMNAYRVYLNKQKNRKTAERIYNVTTVKYIEGLATSLDILNTHTQFLNAENDYINSALSLLKTGEEIEKILAKEE